VDATTVRGGPDLIRGYPALHRDGPGQRVRLLYSRSIQIQSNNSQRPPLRVRQHQFQLRNLLDSGKLEFAFGTVDSPRMFCSRREKCGVDKDSRGLSQSLCGPAIPEKLYCSRAGDREPARCRREIQQTDRVGSDAVAFTTKNFSFFFLQKKKQIFPPRAKERRKSGHRGGGGGGRNRPQNLR